jgi:hypothetical protein
MAALKAGDRVLIRKNSDAGIKLREELDGSVGFVIERSKEFWSGWWVFVPDKRRCFYDDWVDKAEWLVHITFLVPLD